MLKHSLSLLYAVTNNIFLYFWLYDSKSCKKCWLSGLCNISCQPAASSDHHYSTSPYATFLNSKSRGDLIQASYGPCKDVIPAEKVFKLNAINKNKRCTNTYNLVQKMLIDVVFSSNWSVYFPSTDHWFQVSLGFKADHVTQIVKKILS